MIDPAPAPPTGSPRPGGVAIRETICKTILNRSALADYSLNCYTGCTHACAYCYARFMTRFHPHPEPWGRFVDVKVNAVETLARQLRRAQPGEVFVSSACDGWQPVEGERALTRACCALLLDAGFRVNILTKSALVLRDLDLFAGRDARLGVTLTSLEEDLRRPWEPAAAPVEERLRVLAEARAADIRTSVMFGPLLPGLSDSQHSLDAMFERAADLGVGSIYADAINLRQGVWPAVSDLLRRCYPALRPVYARILFDAGARHSYLDQLRQRVARAAERSRLARQTSICF